jgi:hypothetical protein
MGWILLDFTFMAHQYKTYGFITDSMLLSTAFQTLYVLDSFWMESAVMTQMDITTDGFGFMLAFGDLVWVPFTYSIQARYLSVYPLTLGIYGIAGVLGPLGLGYYIFRSSNNEKNRFRTNPDDPRVAHLKFIETKSGSKLLIPDGGAQLDTSTISVTGSNPGHIAFLLESPGTLFSIAPWLQQPANPLQTNHSCMVDQPFILKSCKVLLRGTG